jgi:hydrogenase small subunit
MGDQERWLSRELAWRGVSRRAFLELCGAAAAALSLPRSAAALIAEAVAGRKKPSVVWLELQDCAGCTESFLRAGNPTVADLVLDVLSVDYHETIMAASGARAEEALRAAIGEPGYIAIIEGSIPTAEGGIYCTVGGRSAIDSVREVVRGAAATIAVGTCASFGGLPAASPNPTRAVGVRDVVPEARNLINLPGCPVNAENITALVVHYLAFQEWPALDRHRRPQFAYGKLLHDNCERRAHFDAGQFAHAFGDEGHRSGYCLYELGCKGPASFHNCPSIGWNGNTSWPVACGHPCIGCAEPGFWDRMSPFYQHLTGAGAGIDVDRIGVYATAAVGAGLAGHGLVRLGARLSNGKKKTKVEAPSPPAEPKDPETKGGQP